MAEQATTTSGSRTFQDGVQVTWTPSQTTNSVDLKISIGGTLVWEQNQEGNGTANVNVSGDNYKISGNLDVQFGASGTSGQLRADNLQWTVSGDSHAYTGLVGVW
jgi:hypothetical protein